MKIDISTINKLKINYYEKWNPEQYGYMELELHTGAVVFTNNLDCDGNPYFCYKSFLRVIKKWEQELKELKE